MIFERIKELFGIRKRCGEAPRSPKWHALEQAFLEVHQTCAVCGTKGNLLNRLNVHHVQVFHLHPELELVESNLITLCRAHHFFFGHLMNWRSWNVSVRDDAATWNSKIVNRPQ